MRQSTAGGTEMELFFRKLLLFRNYDFRTAWHSEASQRVSERRSPVQMQSHPSARYTAEADTSGSSPGCSLRYPSARSRCTRNPLRARLHLREAAIPAVSLLR